MGLTPMAVNPLDQVLTGYAFAGDGRVLADISRALPGARVAVHRHGGAFILSAVMPDLDPSWGQAVSQHGEGLLGEARVFSVRTGEEVRVRTADPRLYASLRPRLPAPSGPGLAFRAGVALWEEPRLSPPLPLDRASRRFLAAFAPSAATAAESLICPADGSLSPLARYLLDAARGDPDGTALEGVAGGLTGLSGPVRFSFSADPGPVVDAESADASGASSAEAPAASSAEAPAASEPGEPDADPSRNVFVVYGRDDQARLAIFDFLRALGLHPLEWETILQRKGDAAPYLSEAVRVGLDAAAAVVVLMTPDDVVRLHPDLHEPEEKAGEVRETLQPRPNVLIELGMALAAKNGKTILVKAGDQRDITDLAGFSYVRLADTPECRIRLRQRLEAAGCHPTASTDWLTSGAFDSLAALARKPNDTGIRVRRG